MSHKPYLSNALNVCKMEYATVTTARLGGKAFFDVASVRITQMNEAWSLGVRVSVAPPPTVHDRSVVHVPEKACE